MNQHAQLLLIAKSILRELRVLSETVRTGFLAVQEQIGSIRDQQEAANQQRQQEEQRPQILNAELQIPEAVQRDKRTSDNRQFAVQVVLTIVTFFAFVAAAIYAGIAGYQTFLTRSAIDNSEDSFKKTLYQMQAQTKAQEGAAKAASDSVKATQDAMRLDQRAWVGVVDVRTEGGTETQNEFKYSNAEVSIHNSGKTPALKVSIWCCIFTGGGIGESIPDYDDVIKTDSERAKTLQEKHHKEMEVFLKQHPELAGKAITFEREFYASRKSEFLARYQGGVLAPGVTTSIGFGGVTYPINRTAPTTAIYVLGKITYFDIFPGTNQHTTKFCMMRISGTSFVVCPAGNGMD